MSSPQGFVRAAPAGMKVYRLPLQSVGTKAELMQTFVQTLGLDAGFGRNWDALYDVLTDLNADTALVLQRQGAFAQAHAELWQALEGVLLDAQAFLDKQGVALWLVK